MEEGEGREGEEGELETEQKRDASMMKKEGREGGGMVSANIQEQRIRARFCRSYLTGARARVCHVLRFF